MDLRQIFQFPLIYIEGLPSVTAAEAPNLVTIALLAQLRRQYDQTTFFFEAPREEDAKIDGEEDAKIDVLEFPNSAQFALQLAERIIGTNSRAWPATAGDWRCGADGCVKMLHENPDYAENLLTELRNLGTFKDPLSTTALIAWQAWIHYVRNLASDSNPPEQFEAERIRRTICR